MPLIMLLEVHAKWSNIHYKFLTVTIYSTSVRTLINGLSLFGVLKKCVGIFLNSA